MPGYSDVTRMKFSLDIIGKSLPSLVAGARLAVLPIDPLFALPTAVESSSFSRATLESWQEIRSGDRWGGPGTTWTFAIPLRIPETWTDGRIRLSINLGEYADISGPEGLVSLDGEPLAGVDRYHRDIVLDSRVRPGAQHIITIEAYSSLIPTLQTLGPVELVLLDPEAESLAHDVRVLHSAVRILPEESVERARIVRVLERAYRTLDLRRLDSEAYRRSAGEARVLLQREIFDREVEGSVPRIVAVGHAHIDLAWLWPVAQTRKKGARTFSTVLRLMERFPDYHFVASQPALYEMVREDEPLLYAQILERVRQGRWEPTGASWVEMDCNLAGGESLVRQFLLGKRFFHEEFGIDPHVLWLPDVFGYSAALPQILKGCGVDSFMTTKLSWNEYNRIPNDTFKWRGIDGTDILAHMVTALIEPDDEDHSSSRYYTYNARLTPFDVAGTWDAYRQKGINHRLLYLYGFGDGGGGPTEEMQETANRLHHLPGFPRVEQSSAEAYFEGLHEQVWQDPDLPLWVGELYFEYHRGTYTSQARVKRANRLAELLYREAELWSSLAGDWSKESQQRLTGGWKRLLFNQFHDILPGSSIHQVYVDAEREYVEIRGIGEEARDTAIDRIMEAVAAPVGSLLVLNPAPFERNDPVEVALPAGVALPTLASPDGSMPDWQVIDRAENRVLVAGAAPALGYRVFSPDAVKEGFPTQGHSLSISVHVLENRWFRLQLDDAAEIISLLDKRVNREVIAPGERGNRLVAFEDRPLDFDAWDIQIDYGDKPYPIIALESVTVVEAGPLRGGVEIVRRYERSTITQRIVLYRDVPRIDFPTTIEWHEHQTLLKVAFPVTVNSPRATFDIQFGNVERPTHWNTSWDWARFESCAHKWVDLSEGNYGVSLLNDCKYGHDIFGNTIRLTLIKSGIYPDPDADQGEHIFSYALLPHEGDWRSGETVRHAYLFNMMASARFLTAPGSGSLPTLCSFVRTDRPGLVIETIKPAEDDRGIIVRVYEAYNTRGPATLTFATEIESAEEVDLLERSIGEVRHEGKALRFEARPYGIASFRVRLRA